MRSRFSWGHGCRFGLPKRRRPPCRSTTLFLHAQSPGVMPCRLAPSESAEPSPARDQLAVPPPRLDVIFLCRGVLVGASKPPSTANHNRSDKQVQIEHV